VEVYERTADVREVAVGVGEVAVVVG